MWCECVGFVCQSICVQVRQLLGFSPSTFIGFLFVFQDSVSRGTLGFPGIHSADPFGLELRDLLPLPPHCWE